MCVRPPPRMEFSRDTELGAWTLGGRGQASTLVEAVAEWAACPTGGEFQVMNSVEGQSSGWHVSRDMARHQ